MSKIDISQIPEAKNYHCPGCGNETPDDPEGYDMDGVSYPIISNENKGADLDGAYWDWCETHCCQHCNTKYFFWNSAF
tara:strand:- start:342 stop:575 length:234 start_codon:yes stop_codon:yes gene_type:complete